MMRLYLAIAAATVTLSQVAPPPVTLTVTNRDNFRSFVLTFLDHAEVLEGGAVEAGQHEQLVPRGARPGIDVDGATATKPPGFTRGGARSGRARGGARPRRWRG